MHSTVILSTALTGLCPVCLVLCMQLVLWLARTPWQVELCAHCIGWAVTIVIGAVHVIRSESGLWLAGGSPSSLELCAYSADWAAASVFGAVHVEHVLLQAGVQLN
jgi:hypothetical protein